MNLAPTTSGVDAALLAGLRAIPMHRLAHASALSTRKRRLWFLVWAALSVGEWECIALEAAMMERVEFLLAVPGDLLVERLAQWAATGVVFNA